MPLQIFRPTDEQLMWRVQTTGDGEAFAELVARWEGPIQRLCARMTGDLHKAEDLAQEAFARLFTRRRQYQASAKFSTYLWRIGMNLSHDELRRRNRRPESAMDDSAAGLPDGMADLACSQPTPDSALADTERAETVRRTMARLPEHYRAVVVLRHYENLKFKDIAEVLDIPEGTVKSRMFEALNMMRAWLQPANRPARKYAPSSAVPGEERLCLI